MCYMHLHGLFSLIEIFDAVKEEPLGKISKSKANPEDSGSIRATAGSKDGLGSPMHLESFRLANSWLGFDQICQRCSAYFWGSQEYLP